MQNQEVTVSADDVHRSSFIAHRSALILFAHGSRDPEWSAPFLDIRRRVSARLPDHVVELAYLESMQPTLSDVVARLAESGCRRISIAPLFMAQGGHLKRDLPELVATLRHAHPEIAFDLLQAAGDAAVVRDAISGWLADIVSSGVPAR